MTAVTAVTAGPFGADPVPLADFVTWSDWALARVGFRPSNALALVGVCRDELMHGFEREVARTWGQPFAIGSLAGLVFVGRTGLQAALGHVPGEDGRHRLVAFCFPHIGIDGHGTLGRVERRGRLRSTSACGALASFRADLSDGRRDQRLDPDDLEQSLLRRRLDPLVGRGLVPTLATLTRLARQAAVADLSRYAGEVQTGEPVDIAYLSGIVVHGPAGRDGVVEVQAEVVIDGERIALEH